jgi:hypothetical protein
MTTKEAMFTEFRLAKVKAETLLELIETSATMSPGLVQSAKEQISAATEAYVSMAQLRTQIENLNDISISGDDMDDLKGDLDDIKAMIRSCNREVLGGTPMVAAPTAPALPPTPHPESRHQKTMMELNAADERFTSFDTPILGDVNSYQKEQFSALTYIRNTPEMTRVKVKTSLLIEEVSPVPELSSVDTPRRTEGEWDICCLEHGIQPSAVDDSFLFVSGIARKTPRPILLEPINPPYVNSLASLPWPLYSTSIFKKKPPWPLYSTSSSVSVLFITSSSYRLDEAALLEANCPYSTRLICTKSEEPTRVLYLPATMWHSFTSMDSPTMMSEL